MPFIQSAPPGICWRLDLIQFRELVARPRDSAPGPDGIPYAAWRNAGTCISDVLFNAYAAFMDGVPLPEGFNECILAFIPKGDEVSDTAVVARTPGLTRPISLSNTDSKYFALAINLPLAEVAKISVHPRQRGFVQGRSLVDNLIEVEGYAQSFATASAENPAIVLFDIRAAFPSLAHQWFFVVMRKMGIPRFIIDALKRLYQDGVAIISLLGRRWNRIPVKSGIRQGCPASGSLFVLAMDPCFRYLMHKVGLHNGILTAFADDIAGVVKDLLAAVPIVMKCFATIAGCSALELHPGKVIIVPLWKVEVEVLRNLIHNIDPLLSKAAIQDTGKLLGVFVGPGAPLRQWRNAQEELRVRSRYLASLNLAWSGALPLFGTHVLTVTSHIAQFAPPTKELFKVICDCLAIVSKTPAWSVPPSVLAHLKDYGMSHNVPDFRNVADAATFRAAEMSEVLPGVLKELARARASREVHLSPFMRPWSQKGIIGHMLEVRGRLHALLPALPVARRGLQGWVSRELAGSSLPCRADLSIADRLSTVLRSPVSEEEASRVRLRICAAKASVLPSIIASVLRTVCNAWTTTGRFVGPTAPCPFGCGRHDGDRFSHFPYCPTFAAWWKCECPNAHELVFQPSLDDVLLVSQNLPPEAVVQLALWSDVVGHCLHDIRAMGTTPCLVGTVGRGLIAARLRFLGVQSDSMRNVILLMRASR